mmetsp:Transcript_17356/g.31284  ORF Transcript_17356/g.31284 Transcript_17356/m.31284 type:complete len:767 (-) Transcript_17356:479-2779(-)
MLSDRYEVTLNVTEVYIPFSEKFSILKLRARLADKTVDLVHLTHPSVTVQTYSISRTTPLDLQLYADRYHVGSATITLGDIYAGHVQGHVESWVKLELSANDEEPSSPVGSPSLARVLSEGEVSVKRFARVKLALTVVKQNAQELTSAALAQLGTVSCPFLEKVLKAQRVDTETLDLYKTAVIETTQKLSGSSSLLKLSQVEILGVPEKYLDIEIPNLAGINFDRPSAGDAAVLKHIVIGLSNRVKTLTAKVEETNLLKDQLERSNKARSELQETITETVEGLQRESLGAFAVHKELEEARSTLTTELQQARHENTGLLKVVDQLGAENQLLKREVIELRAKAANQKELETQISSLKTVLKTSESSAGHLRTEREAEVAELYNLKKSHAAERKQLLEEKQALESKLCSKLIELDTTKDQLLRAKGEIEILKTKMNDAKLEQGAGGMYERYDAHNAEARNTLQKQLEQLAEESKQASINSSQIQERLRADLKNLHDALEIVEEELEISQQKERELRRQLTEASGQVVSLEELACVKEDLLSTREDLIRQNEMNRLVKGETLAELDAAADHILLQAQRGKENCQLLGQVEDAMKEQEQEIEQLRFAVALLKSKNATYFPVAGDLVDEVLSDYLNHRDPTPSVPFVRESCEVYVFGTKRVFVRVDHGRINVKVGGGFISIEEFLATYEKPEADKLEARLLLESQQATAESKVRNVVSKIASAGSLSRLGSIIISSGEKSPTNARRAERRVTSPAKAGRSVERKISKAST